MNRRIPLSPRLRFRRWAAERPGSVLILVVALLVLLALVGTAYLTTSRVDRYAAKQFDSAVRLDLLLQGYMNALRAAAIEDLFDQWGDFRPASAVMDPRDPRDYENFDSFLTTRYQISQPAAGVSAGAFTPVPHGDGWLSPRTPWLEEPFISAGQNLPDGRPNFPRWVTIGAPRFGLQYESPYWESPGGAFTPAADSANRFLFGVRDNLQIGTVSIPQDGSSTNVAFPALSVVDPFTHEVKLTMLAMDADGDGIADALPERLQTVGDLTYYVGYRIIDHNSAINVNTALAMTSDFTGSGTITTDVPSLRNAGVGFTMVSGLYPSHVGLLEILRSYIPNPSGTPRLTNQSPEFNKLNDWRFGSAYVPASNTFRAVGIEGNNPANNNPVSDEAYGFWPRDDMNFNTVGEALWMQLGRRVENPGVNVSTIPYRAYDIASSAALAYRGSVVDNLSSSDTQLELDLDFSLSPPARRPYRAADVFKWYNENFLLDLETPFDPDGVPGNAVPFHQRRPILTATNATANAVASNRNGLNTGTAQYLVPAPLARYSGQAAIVGVDNPRTEIDRSADPELPAFVGKLNDAYRRPPTKVNINTASFGELWRGFWQVMSYPRVAQKDRNGNERVLSDGFIGLGDGGGTPFTEAIKTDLARRAAAGQVVEGFTPYDPYLGMRFDHGLPNDPDPNVQTFLMPTSNYWGPSLSVGAFTPLTAVNTNYADGFHPARMFRSPLRGVPEASATPRTNEYSRNTFRMPADQVVLLRSAIAAVNAEQLRSRSDDLIVRTIVGYPRGGTGSTLSDARSVTQNGVSGYREPQGNSLLVAGPPRADLDIGTGGQGLLLQPVTVRIFGVGRQPFLTEVYLNTNNEFDPNPAGLGAGTINPRGYVALELYNPYPFPIDIRHCRIFTVDRTPEGPYNSANPPGLVLVDESQQGNADDRIILDPRRDGGPRSNTAGDPFGVNAGPNARLIIPPRGYLVMENYATPGNPSTVRTYAANSRPASSGAAMMGEMGGVGGAGVPGANWVYVPNLDRLFNREFILVRYHKADRPVVSYTGYSGPALEYAEVPALSPPPDQPPPEWDPREFAPLDSFDFTGVDCPADSPVGSRRTAFQPAGTVDSTNWHYNRATPTVNSDNQKEWRYVYPGRYDASQPWKDVTGGGGGGALPANETGYPRQQGVRRHVYDPDPVASTTPDPWIEDPTSPAPRSRLTAASLGTDPPSGTHASYVWFDPIAGVDKGEFTIPLHSLEAFRDPSNPAAGMDWAQWPGISAVMSGTGVAPANHYGVYRRNRYPFGGFARNLDVLQVTFIGSYWVQHAFDFHDNDVATFPRDHNPSDPNAGSLANRLDALPPPPPNAPPYPVSSKRIIEINSVTMDSMFCEDTDTLDDPTVRMRDEVGAADALPEDTRHSSKEQVGRFCPLRPSSARGDRIDFPGDSGYLGGSQSFATPRYGDYWEDIDAWRYHWAKKVAEQFTVQSQDEALTASANPSADPFNPVTGRPVPPHTVKSRMGKGAPKYTYAKVIGGSPAGSGIRTITVTQLPDWIANSTSSLAVTFVGGPHDGQRRPVTNITVNPGAGTNPPTATLNVRVTGGTAADDPRPWDSTQPIQLGDLVRFDGVPEDPGGIEGLININTASARVLSTLPWFPPPPGAKFPTNYVTWNPVTKTLSALPPGSIDPNNRDDNWDLAQAIVWWRDRERYSSVTAVNSPLPPGLDHIPGGPFTSIFDLYNCPAFKTAQEALLDTGKAMGPFPEHDVGLLEGDFTFSEHYAGVNRFPRNTDGIRFDFKEQYLLLNRVSNLITVRSDVFTIYAVIQAWRNVGTDKPQFVSELRKAIILDRNRVTPKNLKPAEYKMVTD